jgi:hypothetical protein
MTINTRTVYKLMDHQDGRWIHLDGNPLAPTGVPIGSLHLKGLTSVIQNNHKYLHVRVDTRPGLSKFLIILGVAAMLAGGVTLGLDKADELTLDADTFNGMIGMISAGGLIWLWGMKRTFWGSKKEWVDTGLIDQPSTEA